MKTPVLIGADPNVASPQVQWRWEAERRGKPRSPRPPERNQSPDKLVLNWKRRALSLPVGNERLVQNSGVKIGNLFIDNLSDVKSSQVLKLAILKKLSQKRVADFHDEDGTHPDWASVSFGLTFYHTMVHSMTCLIVIWLPVGWTMKKYLSQAMRRIENEEKKTQVDWIAPISLHKISWRRKKTFSSVFVYFNLPCSVQESNSWWGCRQEWEAWRRSRGGCRTRPRWRWRCSAWSASPLRTGQANIKFNKTFV